jgi:peptidoglycan/xylan/chitin deacetylase (PgdA/CDA1 family)
MIRSLGDHDFGSSVFARSGKLLISVAYLSLRGILARIRRLCGGHREGSCTILYYHSVPDAYRDRFERQMVWLARKDVVLDVSALDNLPANCHSVILTFDDGLQSFADNALPVLSRLHLPVTVFAVAQGFGQPPSWSSDMYFQDGELVMSAEQLRNLPEHVTIGAHTLTHPNLTRLDLQSSVREISGAREVLAELLGRSPTIFSFPFGRFNESLVALCKEAGYRRTFSIEPELTRTRSLGFVVGRLGVEPWDWLLVFRLKASGAYAWSGRYNIHKFREQLCKLKSRVGLRTGFSWR